MMKFLPSDSYTVEKSFCGWCVKFNGVCLCNENGFEQEGDAYSYAWGHYNNGLRTKISKVKQKQDRRSPPPGYVILKDNKGKVRCGEGFSFEDDEFDIEIYADRSLTWDEALKACWEDYDLHKQLEVPDGYKVVLFWGLHTAIAIELDGSETNIGSFTERSDAIKKCWADSKNPKPKEKKMNTNIPTTITRNNKEFQLKVENDKEIVYKAKNRFDETNTKPGMVFYCEAAKTFIVITKARHPEKWNWSSVGYSTLRSETTGHEGFDTQQDLIECLNGLPSCHPCAVGTEKCNGQFKLTIYR